MLPDDSTACILPPSSQQNAATSPISAPVANVDKQPSSSSSTSSAGEIFSLQSMLFSSSLQTTAAQSIPQTYQIVIQLLKKRSARLQRFLASALQLQFSQQNARLANVLAAVLLWLITKWLYAFSLNHLAPTQKTGVLAISAVTAAFLLLLGSIFGQIFFSSLLVWLQQKDGLHSPAVQTNSDYTTNSSEDSTGKNRYGGSNRLIYYWKRRAFAVATGSSMFDHWKIVAFQAFCRVLSLILWIAVLQSIIGPWRVLVLEHLEYIIAPAIIVDIMSIPNLPTSWKTFLGASPSSALHNISSSNVGVSSSAQLQPNASATNGHVSGGGGSAVKEQQRLALMQQRAPVLLVLAGAAAALVAMSAGAQNQIAEDENASSLAYFFPSLSVISLVRYLFCLVFLGFALIVNSIRKFQLNSAQSNAVAAGQFSPDYAFQSSVVACILCVPLSLVWSLVWYSNSASAAGEGFSMGTFLDLLIYGFLVLSLPSFTLSVVKSILANPDTALFGTGTGTAGETVLPLSAAAASAVDATMPTSGALAAQGPRSGTRRSLIEILCVKKKNTRFSFMLLASAVLGWLHCSLWNNLHLFVPAVLSLIIFAEKLTNVKKRKTKGDDDSSRRGVSASAAATALFAQWLPSKLTLNTNNRQFAKRLQEYLQFIMNNKDSRYLFLFLLANLAFMFVELVYGLWSNSLGLISDSAHMLFDCSALAIGLYGAFMSKWKPNEVYTYGYGRFETLSAFVNGLLLVFIAIYVFVESLHRVFDPPVVQGSKLLLISCLGFVINMTGVIFFHQDVIQNENTYGVYLHMLADTLGSVGVIFSTLIIQYFGWYIADPICSFLISLLIFSASLPLLMHSGRVLMQRWPTGSSEDNTKKILQQIATQWPGVVQVSQCHFWVMGADKNVGSLKVRVQHDVDEQEMLKRITLTLRDECKIHDLTVQIEKIAPPAAMTQETAASVSTQ